ncbi:MAG: DoxX family protein [Saprospiraceae bacterium]|nr:DoxX family protein [Saprospiraceae bacterium]
MSKVFAFIAYEKLGKLTSLGLLILRVGVGLSMVYGHGFPKLVKFFGDDPIRFGNPLGLGEEVTFVIAILAEFLCASLVVIGLFTRWATIPLMLTMLTVIFFVKWGDPFGEWELPAMYLFSFAVIFLVGPGRYSLDYKLIGGR